MFSGDVYFWKSRSITHWWILFKFSAIQNSLKMINRNNWISPYPDIYKWLLQTFSESWFRIWVLKVKNTRNSQNTHAITSSVMQGAAPDVPRLPQEPQPAATQRRVAAGFALRRHRRGVGASFFTYPFLFFSKQKKKDKRILQFDTSRSLSNFQFFYFLSFQPNWIMY